MFVFAETHRFWWPVKVKLPDPDRPGDQLEQSFSMLFEAMPKDGAKQMMDELVAAGVDPVDQQIAFVKAVARDWSDVQDTSKASVPFSDATLDRALQFPWIRQGAFDAYIEASSGQKARLGN